MFPGHVFSFAIADSVLAAASTAQIKRTLYQSIMNFLCENEFVFIIWVYHHAKMEVTVPNMANDAHKERDVFQIFPGEPYALCQPRYWHAGIRSIHPRIRAHGQQRIVRQMSSLP
ncbi:hypothetical protein D3C85_1398150 [compost metagenome]